MPETTGPNILLVEDDAELRVLLIMLLRRDGNEVTVAEDALHAVSRAVKEVPDLVILDLGLPGGGGTIVNIGSLAGKQAFPRAAAYCASKFGLVGFSEALMQEVRHQHIRVSYVMPGSVDTSFGGGGGSPQPWKLTPADVAEVVLDVLRQDSRALASRVELRPSEPPQK